MDSIFVLGHVHYTFRGILDNVVLVVVVPSVGGWVHIPTCDMFNCNSFNYILWLHYVRPCGVAVGALLTCGRILVVD